MGRSVNHAVARLLVVLASALLVACGRIEPPEKSGELVIGIIAGPTTYQDDAAGISGFEHDLLEGFAAALKLRTRYVAVKDPDALFKKLRAGRIHLAAGVPIDGNQELVFSAPIRESRQVLVGNADDLSVDSDPIDLTGRSIETLLDSPQAETLQKLAGTPPRFTIVEIAVGSERELLQRVANAKSHLAATDMLNYSLALNYYPDLAIVQELPDQIRCGWAFLPEYASLAQKADAFIAAARQNGSLARLQDRYFGHIQRIKADGVARFINDIRTVLPRYRQQFQTAQAESGIDWRLIAAMAYQESKWDPLATSFTNVRGMMMLTEDTADRMGVSNRLDAGQSIRAGARYLAVLMEQLPGEIMEPDRTWLALAAYNLGMGHLNGARTFARQMKRDSGSWYDMKKVLPLMSQPGYYSRLKSGPARGGEAVVMVENIRNYYDILSRLEPPWQPTPKLSLSLR
ncbi:Membrane-bound lytic murein transglycosylase F [Georgfuchsia toluolica]|uniref:Membrane-bound lytic murein transglycosylase F n=2 Tax=Georgfuchsia toluolica TaxID=424218 RepID=A0A916J6Z9_9PROT|nr:Membrane-bound lytic murein transglycosylase F [Georgfuchsia toluolica]